MEAGRAGGVATLSVVWRASQSPSCLLREKRQGGGGEVGKGPVQVEYEGKEERAKT